MADNDPRKKDETDTDESIESILSVGNQGGRYFSQKVTQPKDQSQVSLETQEEEFQADLDDAVVRPIQETDQDTPETVGNLGTVHTGSRIEETIGPEVNTVKCTRNRGTKP